MVMQSQSPTDFVTRMVMLQSAARGQGALLDELATVPGVAGIMLTFDDFLAGMDQFGTRIQPLMESRSHVVAKAA